MLEQLIQKQLCEIHHLFHKTYENNAAGKLSNEQFYQISAGYETEQEEIPTEITKLTEEIEQTTQL